MSQLDLHTRTIHATLKMGNNCQRARLGPVHHQGVVTHLP